MGIGHKSPCEVTVYTKPVVSAKLYAGATGITEKKDRHGRVIKIGDHLAIPQSNWLAYGVVYGFGKNTVRFKYMHVMTGLVIDYAKGYNMHPERCMVIPPVDFSWKQEVKNA